MNGLTCGVQRMKHKIFVIDTHPVQYKAPVYRAVNSASPGIFEVVYASDLSVKGQLDKEFGVHVAWDTPLLSGYEFRVLGNECTEPKRRIDRFGAKGVYSLIKNERPAAVMLTQSSYWFDLIAFAAAVLCRVPIIVRQETQDETYAAQRGRLKGLLRSIAYRFYYSFASDFLVFGVLNRDHLLRHGVPERKMTYARFSVANPVRDWSDDRRRVEAGNVRARLGIDPKSKVLGFFGKLISKKNPELIYEALEFIAPRELSGLVLLFVGAGELEAKLKARAEEALRKFGVRSEFCGFVNQSRLHEYYLATDVMCLPSRHAGEAWGLVVNEALQCGCSVAITDGVGCAEEFGGWERVRVTPSEDARALGSSLTYLLSLERHFTWADGAMLEYSTESASNAVRSVFLKYCPSPIN